MGVEDLTSAKGLLKFSIKNCASLIYTFAVDSIYFILD